MIAAIPTNNDVAAALTKVKNRKTPRSSGILPEMVKMGINNGEFCDLLIKLCGRKSECHKSGLIPS